MTVKILYKKEEADSAGGRFWTLFASASSYTPAAGPYFTGFITPSKGCDVTMKDSDSNAFTSPELLGRLWQRHFADLRGVAIDAPVKNVKIWKKKHWDWKERPQILDSMSNGSCRMFNDSLTPYNGISDWKLSIFLSRLVYIWSIS